MISYKTFATLFGEAKEYTDIDRYIMERGWQEWMDGLLTTKIADMLTDIYTISNGKFSNLLNASGLTQTGFAKKYYIPLRTIQNWVGGHRNPPEYLMIMMTYITILDKYA